MSRPRIAAVVVVLLGAGVGSGCPSRVGDARDLAVSSDARARVVVNDAILALREGRLDVVLGRFCDRSDSGLDRARGVLLPAVGRSDVVIRRVEPAWVGTEPFFFVEIGTGDGAWEHGLGVQVKTGCLERAVGAPDARSGDSADDDDRADPSAPATDAGASP